MAKYYQVNRENSKHTITPHNTNLPVTFLNTNTCSTYCIYTTLLDYMKRMKILKLEKS